MKALQIETVAVKQRSTSLEKLYELEWDGRQHEICRCCGGINPKHESQRLPQHLLGHDISCVFAEMIIELGGNTTFSKVSNEQECCKLAK